MSSPEATTSPASAPPADPPIDSVADGSTRHLDPRQVALEQTIGWITAGVVSVPVLGGTTTAALLAPVPWWVALAMPLVALATLGAFAWWLHRWPAIAHRHASYVVDPHGIEIRRGVKWRHVINVPRSRVQHTDVTQGPLERGHGLGTLVIYTAGTAHAEVELSGLDHATAIGIRDHLLPRDRADAV